MIAAVHPIRLKRRNALPINGGLARFVSDLLQIQFIVYCRNPYTNNALPAAIATYCFAPTA
jgi:hypothetical protein